MMRACFITNFFINVFYFLKLYSCQFHFTNPCFYLRIYFSYHFFFSLAFRSFWLTLNISDLHLNFGTHHCLPICFRSPCWTIKSFIFLEKTNIYIIHFNGLDNFLFVSFKKDMPFNWLLFSIKILFFNNIDNFFIFFFFLR